jgi:hypothetical protein
MLIDLKNYFFFFLNGCSFWQPSGHSFCTADFSTKQTSKEIACVLYLLVKELS